MAVIQYVQVIPVGFSAKRWICFATVCSSNVSNRVMSFFHEAYGSESNQYWIAAFLRWYSIEYSASILRRWEAGSHRTPRCWYQPLDNRLPLDSVFHDTSFSSLRTFSVVRAACGEGERNKNKVVENLCDVLQLRVSCIVHVYRMKWYKLCC